MNSDTYIAGPISVTEHYSPEFNKYVYLFGDQHEKRDNPCGSQTTIHVKDAIHNLFNAHNADLFLEISKIPYEKTKQPLLELMKRLLNIENITRASSYLKDTIDFFKGRRIHFHPVDFRETCLVFTHNTIFKNSICIIREILNSLCLVVFGIKNIDKIKIIREWLQCDIVERSIQHIAQKTTTQLEQEIHQFEMCSNIRADIYNIHNPELREYFIDKLEKARKRTLHMLKRLVKIVSGLHRVRSYHSIVVKYYPDFLMEYMDLHVLVCLFHSKKQTAIVYVGNIHANQYRKDLQKLGFELVRSYSNRNNNTCVRF